MQNQGTLSEKEIEADALKGNPLAQPIRPRSITAVRQRRYRIEVNCETAYRCSGSIGAVGQPYP
jgi:hypothetical protein